MAFCPKHETGLGPVSDRRAWAVERITGEKPKRYNGRTINQRDWFLVPYE